MARSHGRIKVEIWVDEDFRALGPAAQRAYLLLLSQPRINNCGVLPYVPRRWAMFAAGDTLEGVRLALGELEAARFIVADEETEEVLVRTFIRHDRIERQPNLLKAARAEFLEIESQRIRHELREEYPHLFAQKGLQKPLFADPDEGVTKDLPEGVSSEGVTEGVSDRARDRADAWRAAPAPTPTHNPTAEALAVEAERSELRRASDLPIENERLTLELLAAIGKDGDEGTPTVIRSYAGQLPEGALAKVIESLGTAKPKNRAAYAVGALKDEVESRRPPPPPTPRSQLLRSDPRGFVETYGWELEPEALEKLLAEHVTDEDERIGLVDLAADLRREAGSEASAV